MLRTIEVLTPVVLTPYGDEDVFFTSIAVTRAISRELE